MSTCVLWHKYTLKYFNLTLTLKNKKLRKVKHTWIRQYEILKSKARSNFRCLQIDIGIGFIHKSWIMSKLSTLRHMRERLGWGKKNGFQWLSCAWIGGLARYWDIVGYGPHSLSQGCHKHDIANARIRRSPNLATMV